VYSSHTFGDDPERQVKVILLDTRYFRDSYVIPGIGGTSLPYAALIAAAVRFACGLVGLGSGHRGDILGEEQWRWLEAQLEGSESSVHLLVSSIQGHHPPCIDSRHGRTPHTYACARTPTHHL
jgi:alkaline phosphatase D